MANNLIEKNETDSGTFICLNRGVLGCGGVAVCSFLFFFFYPISPLN